MALDPQVEALLQQSTALGRPPIELLSVEEARAEAPLGHDASVPFDQVASVVERAIPGPAGDVPLRIYTPEGSGPFPILVHIHGGGWVICSLDTHERECRALASGAGCVVVSIDYRMAPEHKFPGPLQDCAAALRWVFAHAGELNGDASRVAIGGDSAGGNLAAATTILARDEGVGPLVGQLLIYPVTEHYSADLPSYGEYADGFGLTRNAMIWFWDHYLPSPDQAANPLAAPLRASDLSGLPPAFVITAEYDVLRDEGEQYAERLRAAGNTVQLKRYDGTIHGFTNMSAVLDGGKRGLADAVAWLRERFG